MRRILIFVYLLLIIFTPKVLAAPDDIVINEFLPNPSSGKAWIELYNPLDISVNINNWVLKNDNPSLIGRFNITLDAKSFTATDTANINLHNDHDTITLFDQNNNQIDSYKYDIGPGEDKSYGREEDGADNFIIFSSPTKGYSNNQTTPTPTETPTMTPSPTELPTSTPNPTVTPTPLVIPTPTSINIQDILEKRMQCRFSYERFKNLPNGEYFINLFKSLFGSKSVCTP